MIKWRILDIDGFPACGEAWRIVHLLYGPAIPLPLWHMLQSGQYQRIIRGFTLS